MPRSSMQPVSSQPCESELCKALQQYEVPVGEAQPHHLRDYLLYYLQTLKELSPADSYRLNNSEWSKEDERRFFHFSIGTLAQL